MAKGERQLQENVAALTVRVPRTVVSDIDQERQAGAVRVPRNTWILEAVMEKLDRERHNGESHITREADDGPQ